MGTNKRYADSIDMRAEQRVAGERPPPDRVPQPPVRDWQTPWPPVRIGEFEWIIMRQSKMEPAAVIRIVRMGPRNETFYRVVTWAPASEGRSLVGYYATLGDADRAVLFSPGEVTPR